MGPDVVAQKVVEDGITHTERLAHCCQLFAQIC